MSRYVGLDWARNGWLGIVLRDNGDHDFDLFPSILSVWKDHKDADRILIDIPIGLSNTSKRACDEVAEKRLKPERHNSVFSTPVRRAVCAKRLSKAKEINEEYGFSITNQAWSICPRIREVDEFLHEFPEAIGTLRESHPEICFASLNDDTPMRHGKGKREGLKERQDVLFEKNRSFNPLYKEIVETFIEPPSWARRLSINAKDDILDSLVLAYTAQLGETELTTLPTVPDMDQSKATPVPIEIVTAK